MNLKVRDQPHNLNLFSSHLTILQSPTVINRLKQRLEIVQVAGNCYRKTEVLVKLENLFSISTVLVVVLTLVE